MPNKVKQERILSRRSFLYSTCAAAGAVALSGCTQVTSGQDNAATAQNEVEIKQSTCNGNCLGGCPMNVHVRDGKATYVTLADFPDPDLWQMCQRGHTHLQRLYDPKRIQYPMRRKEGTERGAGEWERISWDEALDEIAAKWKTYQAESGDNSIIFSHGTGNQRSDSSANGALLCDMMGASSMDTGYDNNGMYTFNDTIGWGSVFIGNDPRDMLNSKTIFVWGNNVTRSFTVRWRWLNRAIQNGAHTVCIDPNYTMVASKCDEFVSIRPGTDGLLAIGMMQVILEEGLQDEESLITKSVAPFLVKEDTLYLRQSDLANLADDAETDAILVWDKATRQAVPFEEAEDPALEGTFTVNGQRVTTAYSLLLERLQEWDMATIAQYTDIPAEKIRDLALRFANGPSVVYTAYGPDHYANGVTAYTNMSALCMLTGNIGKPGAGVNGISCPQAMGPMSPVVTPEGAKGSFYISAQYVPDAIEAGKWGEVPFSPRSMYLYGHNLLANMGGRSRWLEVFEKLDFIVCADVVMTETCQHSDLVLPVAHFFESEGYNTYGSYYVKYAEEIVPPSFESKLDFDIFAELGRRMGFDNAFTMTLDEFNQKSFENPFAEMLGITWDRVKNEKLVYSWAADNYVEGEAGFNTPTGRGQFYFEGVRPSPDLGQPWDQKRESLPYWEPPYNAWFENEKFKEYPLILTTERDKFKCHTQFGFVPELLEIEPEPYVKINPEDAAERGIEENDVVRIYNELGYVVLKAHINAGQRRGVMVMNHGWQEEHFIDGHYSNLSSTVTSARFSSNSVFDSLVEIKKEGE